MGCETYCSHGGVCELDADHEGLHDTRFCQFTDEEAITQEEADEIIAQQPGGVELLATYQFEEET